MANNLAKQHPCFNSICNIVDEDPCVIEDLLSQTPVGEVWGVGRKIRQRLEKMQITSVLDLVEADPKMIGKQFSVVLENTVKELRGIACLEVEHIVPDRRQVLSSRSFGQPILDKDSLSEALTEFTLRAVERLRSQKLLCKAIGVSIRTNRFNQAGHRYKKAEIVLLDIIPRHSHAIDLFQDTTAMLRRQELSVTFDDINKKFGKDTMLLGRLITPNGRKWAMNQNFKSPSYLTNWEEILRVN